LYTKLYFYSNYIELKLYIKIIYYNNSPCNTNNNYLLYSNITAAINY